MHKVDLPLESKEAAALEARREREKQRQSRIFNARHRTMGVDVEALRSQVEERKLREETEKRRDESYDAERVLCDRVAQMLEEEERQRVRRLHQAVQEFREREQPPPTRREWDLYNPEGLRRDQPARVSDYDPRCGPASLQRFAGEDLALPTRRRLQQEQQCRSLEDQRADQQRALANAKYADTLEDKKRVELDLRAQQLAQLEEECRRAKDLATADYNRAQAVEAAEQHRLACQREQDDNQAEIHNHLTGQLLTEDPAVAESPLGPHRILTDRWKGMSPTQVEAVWKAQEEQRQENQATVPAEGGVHQSAQRPVPPAVQYQQPLGPAPGHRLRNPHGPPPALPGHAQSPPLSLPLPHPIPALPGHAQSPPPAPIITLTPPAHTQFPPPRPAWTHPVPAPCPTMTRPRVSPPMARTPPLPPCWGGSDTRPCSFSHNGIQ
ncbi:RIB43A-like with coiled-coils protein 1 isoform X1 [Chrysemys picta bellii]|uniref:RIB43A-like with coiled-coils protein 1 isoform X1 n=1 Tax=Chrysemys picta bellii TaxID=8478 RepID=UPI001C662EA6|nr:RIB43A-like with coiled-coils protein 1 isoform X1 [Chrysemys picta bellii]